MLYIIFTKVSPIMYLVSKHNMPSCHIMLMLVKEYRPYSSPDSVMISMLAFHSRGSGFNSHPDPGLNVIEVFRKAGHFAV